MTIAVNNTTYLSVCMSVEHMFMSSCSVMSLTMSPSYLASNSSLPPLMKGSHLNQVGCKEVRSKMSFKTDCKIFKKAVDWPTSFVRFTHNASPHQYVIKSKPLECMEPQKRLLLCCWRDVWEPVFSLGKNGRGMLKKADDCMLTKLVLIQFVCWITLAPDLALNALGFSWKFPGRWHSWPAVAMRSAPVLTAWHHEMKDNIRTWEGMGGKRPKTFYSTA